MSRVIPLARPNITKAEVDAVTQVLTTPHLSLGPKLAEFETAFARFCETRGAVACSSGTAALHLALLAVGVAPGDEVITTPFSFVASANCALMAGAKPAFADVDPDSWNLDPDRMEAAITERTRAIVAVDVFGVVADWDRISAVARRRNLALIEDACEALGSRFRRKPAGSFGDIGVFGFYPNKQITTGEGGMIVTDDPQIAALCRSLRNQGRDGGDSWLSHRRLGYNYRLSEMSCALGLAQLGRIERIIAERERVHALYRRCLADEPRIRFQFVPREAKMSWFVCVLRLSDDYTVQDRDRILQQLTSRGIGCANYFAPIHLQPFYAERFGFREGDFPVCEALSARTVALPFHHELSENDVQAICRELRRLL